MHWPRDGRIYTAVSGQLLRKHVPVATQLQSLDYKNGNEGVYYVVRAEELSWRQLG
jgi:hypothetical protein